MSVDSRVVDLKFNYSSFADGVKNVLGGLANLKKGLQLDGAAKGIDKVNAAAKGANLSPMTNGVAEVTRGFSVMEIAGVAALATIVSKAVSAGAQFAKSFSFAPIMDGFGEYELKMKSIQTILANTERHGTDLATVNSELDELNKYADKTIYNFAEMTKNASLFTNSGMKIEDATQVIKGFSNAAAASGTGASEAAGAAFQLSQAFATGTIRLMDWRSLTNRGMGNKNMQDSLVEIAGAMGTLNGNTTSAEKIQKDFNGSLETGWLSADVMTTYLRVMAGEYDAAQLSAMGLSEESAAGLLKQAATAEEAATKVRTFTQLMGTMKEAVASGWTDTFGILIGDFEQATDLFTGISDVVGGFLSRSSERRNQLLTEFAARGGRQDMLVGFKNVFDGMLAVIKPVTEAFREIFPAKTGRDLAIMASNFRQFTAGLKIGGETAENLKRTFAGVFAIFSILGQVLGGAVKFIASFFGEIGKGAGGFLSFTGGIGDFLVSVDAMLKKGGGVTKFFDMLRDALQTPIDLIKQFAGFLSGLFEGFDSGGAAKIGGAFDAIGERLSPLQRIAEVVRTAFSKVFEVAKTVVGKIGDAFSGITDAIAGAFQNANYGKVLDTINTGLLAGIVLMIKRFMSGGITVDAGTGGFFDSFRGTLDSVTEALGTMQASLKSDILLKIAGALALLTVSIVALSMLDAGDISRALVALSVGFIALEKGMTRLADSASILDTLKLPVLAASMMLLAGAMVLMAGAMKIMATMSWEEISKGLVGIGGSLVVIGLAMRAMPQNMVLQAAALVILSVALQGLALAVKHFAGIGWEDTAKGLGSIAAALVVLGAGMRLMPKGMVLQAVALTILAVALNGIALAVRQFGSMDMETIGKGLLAIGASLLIIAAAMWAMPLSMVLLGPALLVVAMAIGVLSGALAVMGGMSWEEIGKGLVTLGGSLLILAIGLNMMSGAIGGALALTVATAALMLLTPVLITLGSLSWEVILTGLGAMAGIFVVLGVAGYALAPVVPVILGLAAAMVLIGAGMALAGVGVLAFASAFAIAVALGAAGVKVLADILGTFISAIPSALAAFGKGIVQLALEIAKGGVAFFKAFTVILQSILKAITENIPRIAQLFMTLIQTALRVIVTMTPTIVNAGLQLIIRLLTVMGNNVGKVADVATTLIVNFMAAIGRNAPRLIQAGVKLIIDLINGIADAIDANASALGAAGGRLAVAIVQGIVKGIGGGIGAVATAAKNLAKGALDAAKSFLGIRSPSKEFEKIGKFVSEGFAQGMNGSRDQIQAAYNSMEELLHEAMNDAADDIVTLTERLGELTSAEKQNEKQINETRQALAQAHADRKLAELGIKRLTFGLGDETNALKKVALEYASYQEQLKSADKALEDSIKTRDDYSASLKNQLADLPDISKDTKLGDYFDDLNAKVLETREFSTAIQKLRDLGLNDAIYKELLAKGPAALPFIAELLSGGKGAVESINTLGEELETISAGIGTTASRELYQAGVDAAQGLVDGLKSKSAELKATMQEMGRFIVDEMKKELGIQSPSREFMKVGSYSVDGLAKGLSNSTGVKAAAQAVGQDALSALRQALVGLGEALDGNLDLNPTITPVLDLTGVKKGAKELTGLMPASGLSLDSSYSKAQSVSRAYTDSRAVGLEDSSAPSEVVKHVEFVQNNYSPKALSQAQLYRQTKNQLSRAKGALSTT